MNKWQMMASGLIALSAAAIAWLLALSGGQAALLTALAILPLPWLALRRRERALLESLASARRALNGSAQPALVLDAQGLAQEANPAFLALTQLSAEHRHETLLSVLPEAWQEFIRDLHQKALAGTCSSAEALLPQGTQSALLRAYALPLINPDGEHQVLLMWDNLSGNNQTLDQLLAREQALLTRSQAFIQTLMDVIPQPVYLKRVDSTQSIYIQVNTAFCSLHNRPRSELVGTSTYELFADQAFASAVHQEELRVLAGIPVFREEQTIDPQTGKDRFTVISKQICKDANGDTVIIGTNFDITPWRMAERNLKQALQREVGRREREQSFIQRIIDVIPYPVHVKDSHSHYLMINEAFVQDRGRSREELLGKDPAQVVKLMVGDNLAAEDTERSRALLSLKEDREILAGGTLRKEEHNFHSVTGAERFRTIFKSGCLDTEGQPAIVTAFFDITQWRIAERNLNEALEREKALLERTHAFIQRLIDLIPDEFYVKDADSRYLLVNQAFLRRRYLRSADQVVGRSMEEIAVAMSEANPAYKDQPDLLAGAISDHLDRIKESHREDLAVLAGQNLLKEDHHIMPHTGEERFFHVAKTSCEDPEGRTVIVCINFNLTAQRLAERKVEELKARIGKDV
ncbi:hypothetical protein GCM10027046_08060 [Uliginosibacterium flavum]|uniref:PAS domain-containing protein n=1 Tax=Uliginosibacterium flavum TaxID=1396831 RepID=A0ABV2TKH7_9RHOO